MSCAFKAAEPLRPVLDHAIAVAGPGGVPLILDIAAVTCRGRRRLNEDVFLVIEPSGAAFVSIGETLSETQAPAWPSDRVRIAVMDGMGGHAQGAEFAQRAAQALLTQPPADTVEALRQIALDLHALLLDWAGGPGIGGCTLVLAELDPKNGSGCLISIGDSRAWLRHGGACHGLTHDHRPVEYAWRDGEISFAEYCAATAQPTNRLAQALGFGSCMVFDRQDQELDRRLRIDLASDLPAERFAHADGLALAIGANDTLLIGTDGLSPAGRPERALGLLLPGTDLAASVTAIAASPEARDNATAVRVRLRPA